MPDHAPHPSAFIFVAEITSGGLAAHVLSTIPPWLGGAVTALVVGVVLRLGDASMRAASEALRARLAVRFPALRSAPPAP